MNTFNNTTALEAFQRFVKAFSKNFSEPVCMIGEELESFFLMMIERGRSDFTHQFMLAATTGSNTLIFSHNTEKYVKTNGAFDVNKYLSLIHPDYSSDYILWSIAIYSYSHKVRGILAPLQQCFRINFPFQLIDGKFYWVLMEAFPLQLDKDNNLISHFNVYTVGQKFDETQNLPLVGDIWDNHFNDEAMSLELKKHRFTRKPFILTTEERRIVDFMNKNREASNEGIAKNFEKSPNTIKAQNVKILEKARESFINQSFQSTKDLVRFLRELDYFEKQQFEVALK